jgi:hypothetical protein
MEGKVGGWTRCHGGMRVTVVDEGACYGDGGGVGARAAIGASDEVSEREREGWGTSG